MRRIRIEASGCYDVLVGPGLLESSGQWIGALSEPCSVALVSDDLVDSLYGDSVWASLERAGFQVSRFTFPNGERSKNMGTLGDILEFFGAMRLSRSDLVVCLGGGVVGDIAGFAAAVYARGTRFVQIPTTLLAAVDSSVGGKTAVNLRSGKNLAGAFAQPALVLCDTDVLRALPEPLTRDGAAEIVKYGVLSDPALLALAASGALSDHIEDVVEKCVRIKRDFTLKDEFDTGVRQLLNLGHTFGHAVEKCSNFEITHGRAVAIGLMAISRAARALGVSEEDCAGPVERALSACGLPTECPFGKQPILSAMLSDKKRRGAEITLVVPIRLGRCVLKRVPTDELGRWACAGGIR